MRRGGIDETEAGIVVELLVQNPPDVVFFVDCKTFYK